MNLDAEFTTSGAAVGLASVNQLWCAARTRLWPGASEVCRGAAERQRQRSNRWMAAALLLTLALGAAATLAWADRNIQGTQIAPYPPLLWPLVLFVTGIVVSILANALANAPAGPTRRPAQRPHPASRPETAHSAGEMPSLFLGGGAGTQLQSSPPTTHRHAGAPAAAEPTTGHANVGGPGGF